MPWEVLSSLKFVDGENISAKNAKQIVPVSDNLGAITAWKVYHHQMEPCTRLQREISKGGDYTDIHLYGSPAKNKVDQKNAKRRTIIYESPWLRPCLRRHI